MNIFIAYYAKDKSIPLMVDSLKQIFEMEEHTVMLEEIKPKLKLKEYEYAKLPFVELENSNFDVSGHDLVIIGTGVWSFFPSPVITAYLKKLKNTKNKSFGLFVVCILPGNALKKISNVLTTMGASIVSTLTIQSIFKLNKKKLCSVKDFAYDLLSKTKK